MFQRPAQIADRAVARAHNKGALALAAPDDAFLLQHRQTIAYSPTTKGQPLSEFPFRRQLAGLHIHTAGNKLAQCADRTCFLFHLIFS